MNAAATDEDLAELVSRAIGTSDLIEFARFDIGAVLRKGPGTRARKMVRIVAGNPVIMKAMVKHAPDAASYTPLTILIAERVDGVHVSYDSMESLIAVYGNDEALAVARDLDKKVQRLMLAIADS